MSWRPVEATIYDEKVIAPTVNDDQNDGYLVGDIWIDETGDQAYIPVDVTTGAAVWLKLTSASAADVTVVTTNFDGILGAGDSDLQTALETIDDHGTTLASLTDVTITAAATGDYLRYGREMKDTALYYR